jgi:hypothetical protein
MEELLTNTSYIADSPEYSIITSVALTCCKIQIVKSSCLS